MTDAVVEDSRGSHRSQNPGLISRLRGMGVASVLVVALALGSCDSMEPAAAGELVVLEAAAPEVWMYTVGSGPHEWRAFPRQAVVSELGSTFLCVEWDGVGQLYFCRLLIDDRGRAILLDRIASDAWMVAGHPDQVVRVTWSEREFQVGPLDGHGSYAEPGKGTLLPTWRLELDLAELRPFTLPLDTLVTRFKLDLP